MQVRKIPVQQTAILPTRNVIFSEDGQISRARVTYISSFNIVWKFILVLWSGQGNSIFSNCDLDLLSKLWSLTVTLNFDRAGSKSIGFLLSSCYTRYIKFELRVIIPSEVIWSRNFDFDGTPPKWRAFSISFRSFLSNHIPSSNFVWSFIRKLWSGQEHSTFSNSGIDLWRTTHIIHSFLSSTATLLTSVNFVWSFIL